MTSSPYEHHYIETNGIRLHVVQAGPKDGPLVILLHGFPDFWYGWRHQIPYLVDAGYRVWVPDQRGYNLSDKPKGMASYTLDHLTDDLMGLIDAAGKEKTFLVGHDWGAAVGWWCASKYPARIEKMVILNVPHHAVMQKTLKTSWSQRLKSWYFFFFQLPKLPEALASLNNWAIITRFLRKSSQPGTFTEEDFEQYHQAWSQPQAFTNMVNWYRAIAQKKLTRLPSSRIKVPTLVIWGVQDQFLSHEMASKSIERCDDGRLVLIEEATHWVPHEEPERVNALIAEFLVTGD